MKHSFKKSWTVILTLLALTFSAVGFTPAQAAGPFTVNSFIDAVDATLGDGVCATAGSVCTLRAAIQEANAWAGADTITFNVSGTILLDSTLPHITDADGLTMDGTGQTVIISGKHAVQVAIVDAGASLTLNNLTIANGEYTIGSGILNSGTLIITNSAFFGNSAAVSGGGIRNQSGTLTITNSTFSGNSTSGQGGAISNSAGTLTVSNSTFTLNTASDAGGGIYAGVGTLTITNSTFSGNSAVGGLGDGLGGGIFSNGLLTITNSTFSGNSATYGGVLHISGGTAILRNTIVANSTSAGNCSGHTAGITNGGNNIDDGTTCGWGSTNGSMSSTNPLLGALADNGGPTQTFALLPGSYAIDAGNSTYCPTNDQRGVARVGTCDIGAFESGGFTLALTAGNNQITPVNTPFATSLQVTVTSKASPAESVDGGQVTFTPPASGASASLTGSPATIVGGAASVNASANGTLGGYNVTASANGATSVDFALRNIGTPVITWSNPANIVYGTALSGTQLNAIANVPGTFTYLPIAGTVLTVGTHTLHVDFTPTDTTNYSGASKDVSITVTLMYNLFLPLILR